MTMAQFWIEEQLAEQEEEMNDQESMTDPWADVPLSELLAKLGYQESDELFSVYNEVEYNMLVSKADALETDADALLAVVRELPTFMPGIGDEHPPQSSIDAAYAALPEHLRGDNNEQSRKA